MAVGRAPATGVASTGSMGQPTAPGPVGLTRPTDSKDPAADASPGTGSGEASGDTAADDPSRSWSTDGAGLRVGDRNAGTVCLREADCQLCGFGSVRGVQRRSTTIRSYQQTRQRTATVSAGGSGAGYGAHPTAVAE